MEDQRSTPRLSDNGLISQKSPQSSDQITGTDASLAFCPLLFSSDAKRSTLHRHRHLESSSTNATTVVTAIVKLRFPSYEPTKKQAAAVAVAIVRAVLAKSFPLSIPSISMCLILPDGRTDGRTRERCIIVPNVVLVSARAKRFTILVASFLPCT